MLWYVITQCYKIAFIFSFVRRVCKTSVYVRLRNSGTRGHSVRYWALRLWKEFENTSPLVRGTVHASGDGEDILLTSKQCCMATVCPHGLCQQIFWSIIPHHVHSSRNNDTTHYFPLSSHTVHLHFPSAWVHKVAYWNVHPCPDRDSNLTGKSTTLETADGPCVGVSTVVWDCSV